MARPTINKVEIAEMALRDLLSADLSAEDRLILTTALATTKGLRPNVNAADHLPIFTTATNGDARVVGCSCGHKPAKRAAMMSQTMSNFNSHLARTGVPRDYSATGNQNPRYIDGPRKGMTMAEAINAGL